MFDKDATVIGSEQMTEDDTVMEDDTLFNEDNTILGDVDATLFSETSEEDETEYRSGTPSLPGCDCPGDPDGGSDRL